MNQRAERRPAVDPAAHHSVDLGARIRACRQTRGISLRSLATRIGISAGALSQIETGKIKPSVPTLYAIVEHLDVTLDMLTTEAADVSPDTPTAGQGHDHLAAMRDSEIAHAIEYVPVASQGIILLRGDERMRRVSGPTLPGLECVVITYAPNSSSPHDGGMVTHEGHELNYLISGELIVDIGGQSLVLAPGDSLSFPSTQPHRLRNPGEQSAEAFTIFMATPGATDPHRHHH